MNTAGLTLLIITWSGVIALNTFCIWRMIKIHREESREKK